MERERAHLRKSSSELFICLSSMKLSKSILSPGHRLRPNKASPFFPKKRLDNPEPSSPKVTCIGQVRVKSKKKKPNRSRRTDISFRKIEAPQGWVHLPVSICDALRTCFSVEGKRREIELVVGGGYEEEDDDENEVSVRRRHVLADIVVEEEAARVSICIPPKNALLLMRCRSDPMKMAALTNRFQFQHGIKEEEFDICEEMVEDKVEMLVQQQQEEGEEEEESISNTSSSFDEQNAEQLEDCCPIQVESSPDCHLAPSIEEVIEEEKEQVNESINEGEEKEQESSITVKESILLDNEDEKDEESSNRLNESINEDEDEEKEQESSITLKNDEVLVIPEKEKHLALKEEDKDEEEELVVTEEKEKAKESIEEQQNEEKPFSLPECLLLMMREPKLSMEVSRETWVCSTDFTTRRPPKPGSDHKRLSFDSKAKRIQPPRSSCSLASMIQHKLAAQELTRCKSAPIRVAAAKPDSCFWKKLEARVGV
ncbi:hypothetical protein SASPL_141677 [Salvia splendens]|uniref:Uncharacterized protein n=1 Tax=Salvia splendens TaxID=180675 RepID=A0A8X8WIE7_SALSN|nr:glutamic acid-rich protein-like [Salvia splendens]KAG6395558.1 hypothetical protein SASPL_141677 [Salvia splendens]